MTVYRDQSADTDLDDRYLSADRIAEILEMKPRDFKERYAPHPDFPEPYRFPRLGGGRSNPRWLESDIRKWVESCRVDFSNRRRQHD